MVARLDDVANFKCEDIMVNMEFPFALKSKIRWSKNALEEHKSPDQIIMRSMDPNYCVVLDLVLHKEHTEILRNENNPLLFRITKRRIRISFEEITSQVNFQLTNPNPIDIHSICKLSATYARRNECSKDDVDARGMWKSNKRIVDNYIDCLIPFPDAKVAFILCIGGSVKYMVKKEFSNFINDYIILQ